MSEQVKRFYAPGLDCMYRDDKDAPRELIPMVLATDYDALHAEAEALRAENGRLSQCLATANSQAEHFEREWYLRGDELEAARGLLAQLRGMINCTVENDADKMPVWISTKHPVIEWIDAFLTATPAPEVRQDESLDDRLKQAGMLSVAELLKGAPLDALIKHAGVHDLATLLQWAEMRRGECLRMMARYDLGEKDKGDDLYEWIVAHCAVFTELHVNMRAALADQGERQEAVAWMLADAVGGSALEFQEADLYDLQRRYGGQIVPLYAEPQPGPDVRGLVSVSTNILGKLQHPTASVNAMDMWKLEEALKPFVDHRQAQQGDSHDT